MFFRKKSARKKPEPMVSAPVQKPVEQPSVTPQPVSPQPVSPMASAAPVTPAVAPTSAPAGEASDGPVPRKRRRNANAKTRLIGFDTSDGRVVDLFDEEKTTSDAGRFQFPVAVVMITKGPGHGESFALKSGMSQIGRNEDQAVCLDFGDTAISRENHAAIVYDPKTHEFLLGHGGKSNIVRLNGRPVVSTCDLNNGDEIEIGETQLRFAALCSPEFNWETTETEEGMDDDDMEIA